AVPVRDPAPPPGPGRAVRPEGAARAGRGRPAGRPAPGAVAGAAPGRPRHGRCRTRDRGAGHNPDGRAAAVHRVPRPVRDHQPAPPGGDRRGGRARQAEAVMLLGPALTVSGVLFALGVLGVLLRRNAIVIFMCVEVMLNAANLAFVAFAQQLGVAGQIFVFFVMAVAAAEAAVGLAIILAVYRHRHTVDLQNINLLKG